MSNRKIVELNGRVCCLLGLVCCEPPAGKTKEEMQVEALAHIMRKVVHSLSDEAEEEEIYTRAATAILEHVDLVPKGVGVAIVQAYGPWLSKTPA